MTRTWANFLGNQAASPRTLATPSTISEVQEVLAAARRAEATVRAVGAGHSVSPLCLTSDVMMSTYGFPDTLEIDRDAGEVTVSAGAVIRDLAARLWEEGLGLSDQGDTAAQTVAGALATGTHGGGRDLPILASAAVGVEVVTASGDVVLFNSRDTPDELRAARVSLGLLGIITRVRLRVQPAYLLREEITPMRFSEFVERHDELMTSRRHVAAFWLPTPHAAGAFGLPNQASQTVIVRSCDPVPEPAHDDGMQSGARTDRSYRILAMAPDPHPPNFLEMEYMVPREQGLVVFDAVRREAMRRDSGITLPIEYRWIAADDAYVSPGYGRDSACISVAVEPDGTEAWFHDRCERIFASVEGRPHWGKVHHLSAARLRELYPGFESFDRVRARLDPTNLFVNGYLRGLLELERE
jgi:FAD/FMN-containing dehydrogenase